jgi:hypothetical protein
MWPLPRPFSENDGNQSRSRLPSRTLQRPIFTPHPHVFFNLCRPSARDASSDEARHGYVLGRHNRERTVLRPGSVSLRNHGIAFFTKLKRMSTLNDLERELSKRSACKTTRWCWKERTVRGVDTVSSDNMKVRVEPCMEKIGIHNFGFGLAILSHVVDARIKSFANTKLSHSIFAVTPVAI